MNFNLPDDIMIQIYSFLDWKDVAKIENNKNILMTLIKLENPGKKVFHEKFYRNLFKNQCFNCYSELNISYLLKICSNCKFIVNNKDFFQCIVVVVYLERKIEILKHVYVAIVNYFVRL